MSSRHSVQQPRPFQAYPTHRTAQTSRSLYPTFLSLPDTIKLQLSFASQGLLEAFRWDKVVAIISSDPEIRANVFKSMLLNSLSLTSIYTFDLLLQPLVANQQKWFHRNVGWFYKALWLLPVICVSLYLNSSWCGLIAKRTFVLQHGSRAAQQAPVTYTGLLTMLATSAYRVVMVFTSIVVGFALGAVPFVGPPLGFCFMCWVDAYYCFEFIWIARGMSLSTRVRHLEERWAYYFAFGLPSAALCMWGSSLANAALFALLFPAYIIMAMNARPIPKDPYSPASSPAGAEDSIRHPSPFVPIRLPIFAVVIFLNDWFVRIISVGGSAGARGNNTGTPRATRQRRRSEGVENAEEGRESDNRPITRGGRRKID